MKDTSKQKQKIKSGEKQGLRARAQAKALRENLRRRKGAKPADEKPPQS